MSSLTKRSSTFSPAVLSQCFRKDADLVPDTLTVLPIPGCPLGSPETSAPESRAAAQSWYRVNGALGLWPGPVTLGPVGQPSDRSTSLPLLE